MHNWYVEDMVNRRMRSERELAAHARMLRKLADRPVPSGRAWLTRWLQRLSLRRTAAGTVTNCAG